MQLQPTTPPAQDSGVQDPNATARPALCRVFETLSLPVPAPPAIPQQQLPDATTFAAAWLPVPLTDATALVPSTQQAGTSSGVQDPAEDDANTRRVLSEALSGRPVAINDPIIVDADPQEVARAADLERQHSEAIRARDDATSTCQESETLLREALFRKQDRLLGSGQPPLPYTTVPREMLANPDEKATAWRAFARELAKLHVGRHHPEWSRRVNDDAGNSCDVLLALDAKNTHTLSGWFLRPQQLVCVCNADGRTQFLPPMPEMEFMEWYSVSDSTRLRKAKKGSTPLETFLAGRRKDTLLPQESDPRWRGQGHH
jgi:hypothetical protein